MNKIIRPIIFMAAILPLFCIAKPSFATLMRTPIDSTFVVVDDINLIQWADVNRFNGTTYTGAFALIFGFL